MLTNTSMLGRAAYSDVPLHRGHSRPFCRAVGIARAAGWCACIPALGSRVATAQSGLKRLPVLVTKGAARSRAGWWNLSGSMWRLTPEAPRGLHSERVRAPVQQRDPRACRGWSSPPAHHGPCSGPRWRSRRAGPTARHYSRPLPPLAATEPRAAGPLRRH